MLATIIQSCINLVVIVLGRRVSLQERPWLDGPMSHLKVIGEDYYALYAKENGYTINNAPDVGLVDDFAEMINPSDPNAAKISARVADFYENTGRYKMDIWAQWFSIMAPFSRLLIRLVSPQQNQLNIPLDALATSHGMASQTIRLASRDGQKILTCWQRKNLKTKQVVFAGFYSHCFIAESQKHCLRATFPLPGGNVTVLLEAQVQPDGSVKMLSNGKRIGESGYYRVRASKPGFVKALRLPVHEEIHVFEDEYGILRTDHKFTYFGIKLLHLHYRMHEVH
jgi:hypothetical protein